jgi:AraC-like DNA-binding protein
VYFRAEFRAPWGVSIADHGTVFHIVEHGKCCLLLNREAKPKLLSAGDLVVVPRGDAHTISSIPPTPAVNFFDLAECNTAYKDRLIRAGGKGPVTRFLCGGMQFENEGTNPLLAVLPPLIHVKATQNRGHSWLHLTAMHVCSELDGGSAGAAEVVTRLTDILFIQTVRWYFEKNSDTAKFGWLAAVRDHQIGRALALLHANPSGPWTIASLARGVALSRSAFAGKFSDLMGEPPLRYLTRLRIDAAARRLCSSDEKLSAIAVASGYESVTAFTRAFRRHMGMTPGEYRESRSSNRPV